MEKVIIVHLNINEDKYRVEDEIEQMKELVKSSKARVVGTVIQNAEGVNSATYIGTGKAYEIKDYAESLGANTIIFNNELTGSQMKNLEDIIDRKIVDRTGLILDIFARRARTKEAKLQVKLAQLEYRLPRLVGFRNYLSREGAGIGTRGPGEQKLEIDRRTIQNEIASIKSRLKKVAGKRRLKRLRREDSNIPIVSLIGYSNAGKSTILNAFLQAEDLSDKKVYSDDLLFATLDTSARLVKLDNDRDIIVTDTVGFVNDLPTKLIESFKSTLEEISISDLLIIVVDASNIDYEMQIEASLDVLKDMRLDDKKILYCFNKMDKLGGQDIKIRRRDRQAIYISAKDPKDIKRLQEKIEEMVFEDYDYYRAKIPYDQIGDFEDVMVFGKQKEASYQEDGVVTQIYIDKKRKEEYEGYIIDD